MKSFPKFEFLASAFYFHTFANRYFQISFILSLQPLAGESGPPLLNGEEVHGVARDVSYICPYSGPIRGTLTITNYKLHFRSIDREPPYIVDMPLGVVSRIEKVGGASSRGENSYGIEIFCKDMRNLRFAHKQENHSRRNVFDKLQKYSFPLAHGTNFFAFKYSETFPENGWSVYEPIAELKRMVSFREMIIVTENEEL